MKKPTLARQMRGWLGIFGKSKEQTSKDMIRIDEENQLIFLYTLPSSSPDM